MIKKILNLTVLGLLVMSFLSCNDDDDNITSISNQDKAIALIKAFETGDQTALNYVSDQTYIQHNANFPDGKAVLNGFITGSSTGITVITHRAFTEGNYVVLHNTYGGTWNNGTPQVAFDIFRFENGLIVEHWDNLQDVANPEIDALNNHTQVDGPTTITSGDITTNKTLVTGMITNILIGAQWSTKDTYFSTSYIQHSPGFPNGIAWMNFADGTSPFYQSLKYLYANGDFVFSMSEGPDPDNVGLNKAYFDLFRIESGKIAEHWDTQQTIPPASEWANTNGKW